MNYQNKYLKYKNKYLQLRKNSQIGGSDSKVINDPKKILLFFKTIFNHINENIIFKSISGTLSKQLKEINNNNITNIKINKYDYDPENIFFQIFINDSTVKYKDVDDLLVLTVRNNDKLHKELTDSWEFI
jgi:hypothetical protein